MSAKTIARNVEPQRQAKLPVPLDEKELKDVVGGYELERVLVSSYSVGGGSGAAGFE